MTSDRAAPLLVEIRTEELPPAQLWRLADAFADSLLDALKKAGLAGDDSHRAKNESGGDKKLATPRRLAALLQNIKSESAAQTTMRRGPQLSACKDSAGAPTKALIGFMQSVGATCENDLQTIEENKKMYVAWKIETPPRRLADELAAIVERVLLHLPAPRLMRWGGNDFKFVRPVRGILMIHGDKIITGEVFGIRAGDSTKGHPVLCAADIATKTAAEYESVLQNHGKVIADINARLQKICGEMIDANLCDGGAVLMDAAEVVSDNTGAVVGEKNSIDRESPLLREVAAMCEFPALHRRTIDEEFMRLPQNCIVECMKKHLRFFPFADKNGKLLAEYFLVADNAPADPGEMLRGYSAVLRARLRDVEFYYKTDKNIPLEEHTAKLRGIVFHKKLGSQHDRIGRVCQIAERAAAMRDGQYSAKEIAAAAQKIQAPLSTLMVGEYPQLQEEMARVYFYDSRPPAKEFNLVCCCYDLEKLVGMFGAGEAPTGSKDPHGLRRNALNIARDFRNWRDIKGAIAAAAESFDGKIADVRDEVYEFILERIRFLFSHNAPFLITFPVPSPNVVDAVLSQKPSDLRRLDEVLDAVYKFAKTKEAAILIAANKRINNILRKSAGGADVESAAADESLFCEKAERELYKTVCSFRERTDAAIAKNDFGGALQMLCSAAAPVNAFFDEVLVNAKDETIRKNRFALLRQLRGLLNRVADISRLA